MSYPAAFDFPPTKLADLLKIPILPLVEDKQPFRQLEYIHGYVKEFGCSALLIEDEYVDRDYMQDHSAFYAASFASYGSVCRRMHFFANIKSGELVKAFQAVDSEMAKGRDSYESACRTFSREHYLGFSVIKPLPGSPVGRTVLRTYPADAAGCDYVRRFGATRDYTVHLLGVDLVVRGLGFQQQDQGVSACATTAIWSSLQKLRDFEDVAAATPAQITVNASRFALPFGRSFPSEGLSLDQMCQGIHALGISPNLVRVETFRQARSIIFSAAVSGIAPILIIRNPRGSRHAVAGAGVKLRRHHQVTIVAGANAIDDMSGDLLGVYVHDDRLGPYVRTKFEERDINGQRQPCLIIDESGRDVPWAITHLLMPVHGKIRTGIAQMLRFSTKFAGFAYASLDALGIPRSPVQVSTRIVRAVHYVEELLEDIGVVGIGRINAFFGDVRLSRYVGVTRLIHPEAGTYDVLVDSTGTQRNSHCLAIICRGEQKARSLEFIRAFAQKFDCAVVA